MKDGRHRMGHKAEHEVDLDTGAVLAGTVQGADQGDTTTIYETCIEGAEQISKISTDSEIPEALSIDGPQEVVADKGYHSNAVLSYMKDAGIRTYISEPKGPRRNWKGKEKKEQEALYANCRRNRGDRGKSLMRKRGELVERSFAHVYDTVGMRRTHHRGHRKILELVMRQVFGIGKPRGLQKALSSPILKAYALCSSPIRQILGLKSRSAHFCRGIFQIRTMQLVRAA